ncbi:Nudix family hydrolase [Marinobacter sp.]|uniref:Nudix family hydrolase n=1 Tax=Marinobacter sp. TaxID=50741 RepID=UPI00384DA739
MLSTGADRVKEVHVAVGVIRRGDRILIARRPDHADQGGLLEFPGGKVEPGETVQHALVRELAEETGLAVPAGSLTPVIGIRHDYGDKRVFLDVWQTRDAQGEPEGREGQKIGWRELDALHDHDFPAANRSIIRALRLPGFYAITGRFSTITEGLERLQRSLAAVRPALVLLRAPWLAPADYAAMAGQARDLCRQSGAGLMLHGGRAEPAGHGFVGCHLPWALASKLVSRPLPAEQWLAVSCHSEHQIAHAVALGADFVTVGPVQETVSHPGATPLGWQGLQQLVQGAPVPVYGLGGLGMEHLARAKDTGAQGVSGIGAWW